MVDNGHSAASPMDEEACFAWFKEKLALLVVPPPAPEDGSPPPPAADPAELWRDDKHAPVVSEFLSSAKGGRLFAYLDADGGLRVQKAVPSGYSALLYFVRDQTKFVTPATIGSVVNFGIIKDNVTDALLSLMSGVHVPAILSNRNWPDSVKKEFTGQLHKFMANLTENAYEAKGQTVLYIPNEEIGSPQQAAKDKDLVQQLESTLIHWTRQIKEVVNNQDNNELGEDAGPLAEIAFWRSRSTDLSGIRNQLDHPGVKSIVSVLEHAKSSYLGPFQSLSNLIKREGVAAESNLEFLSSIEKPCEALAKAAPKDIPPILPRLLHCIRIIWNISLHYNTPDRLVGLLRKVSNEIINRCRSSITIEDVFDGDVEQCMVTLRESIRAGEAWKRAYKSTSDAVAAHSQRPWSFDGSNIFAHIDAFVQRCRDMLDVCEAQMQFAPKGSLPVFGGTRGPEITKSFQGIHKDFQKLVAVLRSLNYSILDVKATGWHDDFNSFKVGVKDLEVMMVNVIILAFDSSSSLTSRVELLEAVQSMSKREMIKRCVERKTSETYNAFLADLSMVKKQFDSNRQNPPIDPAFPRYSGAALWAQSLSRRLEKPMELLAKSQHFLPNTPEAAELSVAYRQAQNSIDELVKKQHLTWFNTIDVSLPQKLENNLIIIKEDEGGMLEMNFDKALLSLFEEVQYWDRMQLEIPYVAMELFSQRDKYRILREQVMLVVRDYNRILSALDPEERLLFADRVHYLDRRIGPGVLKLTWVAPRNQLDYWIKEARKYCKEVYGTVTDYKAANAKIKQNCDLVASTLLVDIKKKKVYAKGEFEEAQVSHREEKRELFTKVYNEIKSTMATTFETFSNDSDEVQHEWAKYTAKVDKRMQEALRQTVKKSLQELSRAINGDPKTGEVTPLFYVIVVLEKNNHVELKPSVDNMFDVIHTVSRELITVIQTVPRITETERGDQGAPRYLQSFYDIISKDEDTTLKTIVTINKGIGQIVEKVSSYLHYWEKKYKQAVWDLDKEAYIRRYEKAKKPLSKFEEDINKYKVLAQEVTAEETTSPNRFLYIDAGPLKQSLLAHCDGWVNKFTGLLNSLALRELEGLYSYFEENTVILSNPPSNLDMLPGHVNLLKELKEAKEPTEARFGPCLDMYRTLERFGVQVTEKEHEMVEGLETRWLTFQQTLADTEMDLEKAKENFREKLAKMVDGFVREVAEFRTEFEEMAPYHVAEVNAAGALEAAEGAVEQAQLKASGFRKKESDLKAGMEIFGMPQPPLKELLQTEKELEQLTALWTIVREWLGSYDGWKDGKFRDLEVEEMENSAVTYAKRVQKLGRDIRGWSSWQSIKDIIEAFKKTMPLISSLRNQAIRPRHWQAVMAAVGEEFDPNGDDFTLAKVTELRLDVHADFIAETSVNATKELNIEHALQAIRETWEVLELDMVPYKEGRDVFKLRSTEDIFTALEDNSVNLSTMKATKFYLVFEEPINEWESKLALVSEIIEIIQKVQLAWMYLENIFIGSEDIRKQLPQESVMFDQVNTTFIKSMAKMAETCNVCKAATLPGMLDTFNDMDAKLEKIQKSLENYLEKKRQQFPRFYFISSDDLLEILGQAKDPMNVQPHFKGMFEGIKRLEMHKPGTEGRRHYESTAMDAPDGEHIPFIGAVQTDGRPEDWLNTVERAAYATTKKHLWKTLEEKGMKKERWVKEFPGQCIISAGQIVWTTECEKALSDPEAAKSALRSLKRKWVNYLNKLTMLTRSRLDKINRKKTVALITIEVHARDVIEKLVKTGCTSTSDFEWVSQLRFYWDKEHNSGVAGATGDCIVKQVLSVFVYGYEYQGNNGRLVMTPLTDRCYMTLGAALFTRRGGNPLGPAGTGKTETVKDFGKALAKYVIVFNCSDGVDYKMTGKMFSGLAQTGAWACLDEFNRIEVEVLSVVATQIGVVMAAVKVNAKRFVFEGQEIRLIPSCGVFVTMNPGYAGRSELPDNLKAIVRPVSMMVPDFTLIAEIMMFSEGFSTAKQLAKKMVAIMELSQQQLSKQDHYDYTLRSFVIPISRAAGAMKRADPDVSEEVIMYRTMKDLIMPKLVFLDLPLFQALLGDLFPGVELPPDSGGKLREAIEYELTAAQLQVVPAWIAKIIQIFDCKVARHGNMIVGKTGAGKSEAWKCLQRAMAKLKKEGVEGEFEKVHVHTINPLALSNDEIYGSFEPSTHEWTDGILARIMRTICKDESSDQKWVLFDGPVDTLWIESMNTLLDDNKLLTLLSGERIMMTPQVSILFEVEDLSQASPATVSRAGMIYLNVEDLGWQPFVTTWLSKKTDQLLVDTIQKQADKYIEKSLEKRRLECKELVQTDRLAAVRQLATLFDAFATPENGVDPADAEHYVPMIEMTFLFALIWSVGASLDDASRRKFDMFLREMDSRFPSADTVYEYWVDPKKKTWASWEEKLSSTYKPPADQPFFKIMVPTVDTVRTRVVAGGLVQVFKHTLLIGNVGVGKTMISQSVLQNLPDGRAAMTINFSAQTSSNSLQDTIEGKLEKRTKRIFAPAGGKKLVVYLDDMSMPQKSKFGFMPPLELLKLWVDNGFWYDRAKQEVKQIVDLQLLATIAPPGGGRNHFSQRIMACFATINVTNPSDGQLKRIFSTLLNNKLSDGFDDEIKPLGDPITTCAIEVFNQITEELLPTPSKSHYLFNTRDLSKVIQGVMQANRNFHDSKEGMLQLWVHESFRIFGDRMWDHGDKAWLQARLDEKLQQTFSTSWGTLFESGECPPFVAFQNFMHSTDNPPYEMVQDSAALKTFLTEKLEDYALEPNTSPMDLVLFKDALHHVCRIHRVLAQPRGNALLVGVGGSGRKSLARLASFVAEVKCFEVQITKNYRVVEFHEDLKELFKQAGVGNKPSVFLFDETQIVVESFLEDINNILSSGEVPNLFTKDEINAVCEDCRNDAKKAGAGETQDELYSFFIGRVIQNLHVVLCMSPIGDGFRERCRMFPGLVNCCTIDWFTEWPADALFEVAQKQLEEENLGSDEVKVNVCKVFVTCHQSTTDMSKKMLDQLKRRNYVTPTNYLEFVNGYRLLLKEKRKFLGNKASKLRGGLDKLAETSVQVAEMQEVCKEKKVVVAKAKTSCEELLVTIVQDKRVADEQEKIVNAEATKIGKEVAEASTIQADCEAGLTKAMPALEAAAKALNVISKKDISELKAYNKPPAAVELCMKGVMTVLQRPTSWDEAKKQMGDAGFLEKLTGFDKDKLVDALLNKIKKYTDNPDFNPEAIGKVAGPAGGMCMWVHAMYVYGNVSKEVAPKRAALKAAQDKVAKMQQAQAVAEGQLAEVKSKLDALNEQHKESQANKQALEDELADLEVKLERAEKLVNGLAGERTRWESSIATFEDLIGFLPGDVVVAAAFMSYAGPFPALYREELGTHTWLASVKTLNIPSSPAFDFANFLADPSDVRDWNIQGLPADNFSTENGVMVTRGRRWPLMVDPQGQANKWVRNMEKDNNVKLLNLNMGDMVRQMETAVQFGNPVLLQDVEETIDPVLEPLLSKSYITKNNQVLVKLGDKEVDVSPEFRLYITSKLSNPHYTPEVSTKATIVNFSTTQTGLEAQLLNTVVQRERPDLDKQKNELVVKVASGKRTLADLEDTLLDLLSNATGSLLDNLELINTLNASKTTSDEVTESLVVAEETAKKIEAASAAYTPCAVRASILYFVLNDLGSIDPMYQFSLDAYTELFLVSIAKSTPSNNLQERIKNIYEYHTYAVYKYTTRGLFEAHKLLLSLQMTVRILQSANAINADEWQFFLKGGVVLDKSAQPANPAPSWISEESWDNITELEEVPHFKGVVQSFEQNAAAWEEWYRSNEPESAELPGEWESKCNELQRMIFVRCLRVDRCMNAITSYVTNSLGRRFVEPPVLDLNETHADSNPLTPLIFVLSPGVDPTNNLRTLATSKGLGDKFSFVALGQGQAPVATRLIDEAVVNGGWVFLANCHLMTSWLPELQKIIEGLEERHPHPDFLLWLSSNPTPQFPLSILQRGIKMTTEPPKGLRANLARLYNTITEESYQECKTAHKYSKLLFSLTYFHSVLLERRKFKTLGLNIPYDFNDTDFGVSDDLLKTYLDEYEDTPWDALKYLISEANYGGRVTDEIDRRVLNSYLNQFYCEDALSTTNYPLSPLPQYYIPEHGTLQSFKDYIGTLPIQDRPEAFGQHPNADISYMITDSKVVLESCLSLQPKTGGSGGGSAREEIVDTILDDLLQQVPEAFDHEGVMKQKADDPSALHVVLFQEIERYNILINGLRSTCALLKKGIKGLVVMSSDLDEMFEALYGGKIPPSWLKAYPSLKPLGAWTRELLQRLAQIQTWIDQGYPKVFWLTGFTYPTGFLTAVKQTTARRNAIPIDTLTWEFSIINLDQAEITQPPKEGVYVKGMFLEGGGWDFENSFLTEPESMELIVPMPIVHFKPTEGKKKSSKGVYQCPLYMYPIRTGSRERPSFMLFVDLKSGQSDPDHWVKRGCALLLSLAQ